LPVLHDTHPRFSEGIPSARDTYVLVRELPPDQIDFVLRGGRLKLPFDALNPIQRLAARRMLSNLQYAVTSREPTGEAVTTLYDGRRDFGSSRLEVQLQGSPDRPGVRAMLHASRNAAGGLPNLLRPWEKPYPSEKPPEWVAREREQERERLRKALRLSEAEPEEPRLRKKVTISRLAPAIPGGPGERCRGRRGRHLVRSGQGASLPTIASSLRSSQ
jgi:hypothetical protein